KVKITSITRNSQEVEVYNLTVDTYNNYFVEDVLVHNKMLGIDLSFLSLLPLIGGGVEIPERGKAESKVKAVEKDQDRLLTNFKEYLTGLIFKFYPLFKEGNKLYEEGKYNDAISKYLGAAELTSDKKIKSALAYSIGNSYYRLFQESIKADNEKDAKGYIVQSRAWYIEALKLNPDNEDAKYNLEIVNTKYKELFTKELFTDVDRIDTKQQESQEQGDLSVVERVDTHREIARKLLPGEMLKILNLDSPENFTNNIKEFDFLSKWKKGVEQEIKELPQKKTEETTAAKKTFAELKEDFEIKTKDKIEGIVPNRGFNSGEADKANNAEQEYDSYQINNRGGAQQDDGIVQYEAWPARSRYIKHRTFQGIDSNGNPADGDNYTNRRYPEFKAFISQSMVEMEDIVVKGVVRGNDGKRYSYILLPVETTQGIGWIDRTKVEIVFQQGDKEIRPKYDLKLGRGNEAYLVLDGDYSGETLSIKYIMGTPEMPKSGLKLKIQETADYTYLPKEIKQNPYIQQLKREFENSKIGKEVKGKDKAIIAFGISAFIIDRLKYSTGGNVKGDNWIEKAVNLGEGDCDVGNMLFVILARSYGIKARLVVGRMDSDGLVTAKEAHGWAEFFNVKGSYWRFIDATPHPVNEHDNWHDVALGDRQGESWEQVSGRFTNAVSEIFSSDKTIDEKFTILDSYLDNFAKKYGRYEYTEGITSIHHNPGTLKLPSRIKELFKNILDDYLYLEPKSTWSNAVPFVRSIYVKYDVIDDTYTPGLSDYKSPIMNILDVECSIRDAMSILEYSDPRDENGWSIRTPVLNVKDLKHFTLKLVKAAKKLGMNEKMHQISRVLQSSLIMIRIYDTRKMIRDVPEFSSAFKSLYTDRFFLDSKDISWVKKNLHKSEKQIADTIIATGNNDEIKDLLECSVGYLPNVQNEQENFFGSIRKDIGRNDRNLKFISGCYNTGKQIYRAITEGTPMPDQELLEESFYYDIVSDFKNDEITKENFLTWASPGGSSKKEKFMKFLKYDIQGHSESMLEYKETKEILSKVDLEDYESCFYAKGLEISNENMLNMAEGIDKLLGAITDKKEQRKYAINVANFAIAKLAKLDKDKPYFEQAVKLNLNVLNSAISYIELPKDADSKIYKDIVSVYCKGANAIYHTFALIEQYNVSNPASQVELSDEEFNQSMANYFNVVNQVEPSLNMAEITLKRYSSGGTKSDPIVLERMARNTPHPIYSHASDKFDMGIYVKDEREGSLQRYEDKDVYNEVRYTRIMDAIVPFMQGFCIDNKQYNDTKGDVLANLSFNQIKQGRTPDVFISFILQKTENKAILEKYMVKELEFYFGNELEKLHTLGGEKHNKAVNKLFDKLDNLIGSVNNFTGLDITKEDLIIEDSKKPVKTPDKDWLKVVST
ncbi:MAG: hypothetical protein H8D54_03600, partial [Candidatus Omnitrophica bacterium]|nr:hypothetical protein [Candidatus Omnitrophota bacterium]